MTHHDAEGIGAFLDSDIDDLSSVLSFTIDYLAGPRRALTVGPVCVLIAAARGLACLACLACLTCVPDLPDLPSVSGFWHAWYFTSAPLSWGARSRVVGTRWGGGYRHACHICTAAQ
jgi:hypothetical protein